MRYGMLGTTELKVSRLALGTVELGMPYGLGLPEPPDDNACLELLRQAFSSGISFLDTAAAYGRSEELIGRAFAGCQERPVIATKVALRPVGGSVLLTGQALKEHVELSVTRSLALLKIEALDLLQIHSAEECFISDEILALTEDLERRGLVRYWAVSTYGERAPLEVLCHPSRFRSLQVAFSLLDRRLASTVLPQCRAQGVGVMFRSVLLQGVLSDRWRSLPTHLAPLQAAARAAADLAEKAGMTLPELALRFALQSPWADTVLFGSTSHLELQANITAAEAGPLPADLLGAVNAIEVSDPLLLHPGNWQLQSPTNPRV